jgi:dihydropteroate synthase
MTRRLLRDSMPLWRIQDTTHDLASRGMVMGVLNVTPDSFSDGGRFFDTAQAVQHGLEMIAEGADILDIGGESTRPGAQPVGETEELRRVTPVIEALRRETRALLSIDTMKPAVARAALDAGADIINDVTGFRDPAMIRVATASRAGLVVMHMQGDPQTMQSHPVYADVVAEVAAYFEERVCTLSAAGISAERIALDPGFGFGKALEHNLELLRAIPRLHVQGRPLVVGVSRKSLIAKFLGDPAIERRRWPTVDLTAWMREAGAQVVRVHDVRPNVEAMRMIEAIRTGA